MSETISVAIASDVDVVTARQRGRELAAKLGFSPGDQTVIAAAISEIARNILTYAGHGAVRMAIEHDGDRSAVTVVGHDQGPGIADIGLAMRDGYSTSGGLGVGLGGARQLMDDFDVVSALGAGTTVTMRKWRPRVHIG
ncbi:MAG: anti-sigma regulatory factor [Gemmatimonadales bacterium]